MPVLKDMRCEACGHVNERMVDSGITSERAYCTGCGAHARLISLCNGGRNSRFRYADFEHCRSYDPAGEGKDFECLGVEVDDGQGNALVERDGNVIGTESKFGKESIRERRDKVKSRQRRKRGGTPQHFEVRRGP